MCTGMRARSAALSRATPSATSCARSSTPRRSRPIPRSPQRWRAASSARCAAGCATTSTGTGASSGPTSSSNAPPAARCASARTWPICATSTESFTGCLLESCRPRWSYHPNVIHSNYKGSRSIMVAPSVFVGSSSEGEEVARAIEYNLRNDAEITVWHNGVFGLNLGYLESLVTALERFDYAILVLTPDDLVSSRDSLRQAPRDNVMFELPVHGWLGTKSHVCCL